MKIFEVDPHVPVEEAGFQQEEEYQRSSDNRLRPARVHASL
jgi:hypothetical protein